MNKLEYIIILIITLFINSCGIARWKEFETPPYKKDVFQDYNMVVPDSDLCVHFSEVIFSEGGDYSLYVSVESNRNERIVIDSIRLNVAFALPKNKQVISKGESYINIDSIYDGSNIKSLNYNVFKDIPFYYKDLDKKGRKQSYHFQYYEDVSRKTKEIDVALFLYYKIGESAKRFTYPIKLKPRWHSTLWIGRDD
jgi:hypothetical protein